MPLLQIPALVWGWGEEPQGDPRNQTAVDSAERIGRNLGWGCSMGRIPGHRQGWGEPRCGRPRAQGRDLETKLGSQQSHRRTYLPPFLLPHSARGVTILMGQEFT